MFRLFRRLGRRLVFRISAVSEKEKSDSHPPRRACTFFYLIFFSFLLCLTPSLHILFFYVFQPVFPFPKLRIVKFDRLLFFLFLFCLLCPTPSLHPFHSFTPSSYFPCRMVATTSMLFCPFSFLSFFRSFFLLLFYLYLFIYF